MAFTFSYFKMLMRNKNMDAIKYLPTFSFITTTARSNSNFLALFYVEKKISSSNIISREIRFDAS